MAVQKMARLCQSLLPSEFEQVKRLAPEIQSFLEKNLPEAVNQAVTLLTIKPDEIVIAASSPMVVNYLRLHSREIQQLLRETFGLEQTLKFRAVPDSLLKLDKPDKLPRPEPVSRQAVESLKLNAQWIEDEDLKAAILSLAESLESD